jgi:outer membrane PBP1 activator LpoA protein
LQLDAEARQVARLAQKSGYQRAFIVGSESGPQKRAAQAFADEWRGLRGEIAGTYLHNNDIASLGKLRESMQNAAPDMVFLALDAPRARQVRGYLGSTAAVYATSQVFASMDDKLANYDLNGVRFVDMPWLLQPDHPAVLAYPHPEPKASLEQERFYALGVDAYRLVQSLLRRSDALEEGLDGITGTLSSGPEHVILRELVPAQFVDGQAQPLQPYAQTP